jgi:hypothetical protein
MCSAGWRGSKRKPRGSRSSSRIASESIFESIEPRLETTETLDDLRVGGRQLLRLAAVEDQVDRPGCPSKGPAELPALVLADDRLPPEVALERLVGDTEAVDLGDRERELIDPLFDGATHSLPVVSHGSTFMHLNTESYRSFP